MFYFITHQSLKSRKVGITNTAAKENRLARFQKHGWELNQTWAHDDGTLIADLETAILRWIRKDLKLPPYLAAIDVGTIGGHSETFSIDGPEDSQIIAQIEIELLRLQTKRGGD